MATSDKYDRQLRLWGPQGQKALSEASILLVNPAACGTETLKNLVLPGIGRFTILAQEDDLQPSSENTTANFFITSSPDPQPAAKIATELLQELNDDVTGSYKLVQSLETVDYTNYVKENHFTLVLVADASLRIVRPLAEVCYGLNVPFIHIRSYGLIGSVRLQLKRHDVVESRPDSSKPDLRIASPFDSLMASYKSSYIDLSSYDDMDHGHIPYVYLLLKALSEWQKDMPGKLPCNFAEKEAFKETVKKLSRNFELEMNFQEAVDSAYLAYTKLEIPWEVKDLMNKVQPLNSDSPVFDILLSALKMFLDAHENEHPLNGSIPDMTSSTGPYVELQEIYQTKAKEDFQEMRRYVDDACVDIGKDTGTISDDELKIFCQNICNIQSVKYRSFEDELNFSGDNVDDVLADLSMATFDPSEPSLHTPLLWFIVMRACELFEERFGCYPGGDDRESSQKSDIEEVSTLVKTLISQMKLDENDLIVNSLSELHVQEMVRYYNAEIHNIASILGGVASQEAVKLITKQYIPLNNTYVFNGIASTAAVYQF